MSHTSIILPGDTGTGQGLAETNSERDETEMKYWIAMATKKQNITQPPHKNPQTMALGLATTSVAVFSPYEAKRKKKDSQLMLLLPGMLRLFVD